MNLLQQFPGQSEPPITSLQAATSVATSLRQQPIKQVSVPTRTAVLSFGQWLPSVQPVPVGSVDCGFEGQLATVLEELGQSAEVAKSPECTGGQPYFPSEAPHQEIGQRSELSGIEQAYVLESRPAIPAFIKRNRLWDLLLEARSPLASAFGETPVKKLTLVEDDEGFISLFCLVLIRGSLEEAKGALNLFDESWWLGHSHKAAGKLNFDFELI